jgi:hypothetical protein
VHRSATSAVAAAPAPTAAPDVAAARPAPYRAPPYIPGRRRLASFVVVVEVTTAGRGHLHNDHKGWMLAMPVRSLRAARYWGKTVERLGRGAPGWVAALTLRSVGTERIRLNHDLADGIACRSCVKCRRAPMEACGRAGTAGAGARGRAGARGARTGRDGGARASHRGVAPLTRGRRAAGRACGELPAVLIRSATGRAPSPDSGPDSPIKRTHPSPRGLRMSNDTGPTSARSARAREFLRKFSAQFARVCGYRNST